MNILDYAKRLGIDLPGTKAIDIEAGKAGYEKYLAETQAERDSLAKFYELENNAPKWWQLGKQLKTAIDNYDYIVGDAKSREEMAQGTPMIQDAKKAMQYENERPNDGWSDDEKWAFGEKYATSPEEAYKLALVINTRHKRKAKEEKEKKVSAWAGKNPINMALATAGSIGTNIFAGGVGYVSANADRELYGKVYDRDYLMPHEFANSLQGGVSEKMNKWSGTIDEDVPIIGGKGLGDVHNIGQSILTTWALSQTGQFGTLAAYFGMSASNGFSDAKARGASDDQAIKMGFLSGAAEAIPEMISMDKLLSVKSSVAVENLFKSALKQAGQEAGEEAITSILTDVADRWVMDDKSNFNLMVNQLVASGMSLEEAQKKAWFDTIEGYAFDAITGAVSGAANVGVQMGSNAITQRYLSGEANAKAKEAYTPIQNDLIAEGKQHKTSEKFATKMENKLAKGKELSGYDLRVLAYETENAARTDEVETVRKAIVEKMKVEGLDESKAKSLGEIALNKAIGHEVSKLQETKLKNNEIASKVYRQISKEGMESGDVESDWARQTPIAELREELEEQKAKADENVLQSSAKNGIIESTKTNGGNTYGNQETVHLRDSSKRYGSKNTEGQVSRMESGSRQVERRQETSRVADREATRIVNEGRKVKTSELGIEGGSTEQTIRLVARSKETTSMKNARKEAEARGLKVKFFVGDNLNITDESGDNIAARAYIKGKNVYVRADHPLYTSEQLMRHELGHDKIAKGEVDIKAVRNSLVEKVGKENIDRVAELYNEAYAGTNMTAEEIWEECICDSLGEMNIFASDKIAEELLDKMLPEISKAAKSTKSPTQTRGSPDGKASRNTYKKTKIRNTVKYLSVSRVGAENMDYINRQLRNLYRGISDGISDGIAIENGNVVYIVDSGRDNGRIDFGVRKILTISNDVVRDEYVRRTNNEAVSDGNISDELSSKIGDGYDNNRGSDLRREFGAELQADKGKSQYKQSRILGENADNRGLTSKYSSPEEAKESGKVSDAKFSIEFADSIANNQRKFANERLSRISSDELERAISDTAQMVETMKPYADILPQDKVGKTLVKNGSYDVSVENTTVCIRTLAYNSFVDMVSEKVGRPLTQMESFLVSQKLYEIAKEPQCLYCYVSLDRKAFNEMVIRYTEQRDAAIKEYEKAGKPKIPSKFDAEWSLFKKFLDGRKATTNMWDRYVGWLTAYNKGEKLISLADISTEAKRLELVEKGGETASQVKDILKYAQSASWAKKQTQYVAYYDEILKLKSAVIRNLNSHYGMRWYSFSDYSGAFIVENMQQITDASIRGLKGLSYTKDTDFAEIFAPTGMNINISVYAKKTENGYEIDAKQSADIKEAIKLRKQYPNVGIVVVATDKGGVEWALAQEWSDVVIPFHTVRTGSDVAEFYNWEIFNSEQSDTVSDQNLWDAYVNEIGKKKASKMVYPNEHQNNRETYLSICESRGLTPRFKSFLDNPNYMKLVNETRQSERETSPLKPIYNLDAAKKSFAKFVDKGGYYEGWYNDGIDVENEAEIVAEDVKAGKKANEVSYGRQDVDFDTLAKTRKTNRQHGKASRELDTKSSYAPTFYSHMSRVIDGIKAEKMGANDVVSYLKGKGVKDEEIKWSGIETFLEGKKSVTKAELQEFVAGSQLQIEEATLSDDVWETHERIILGSGRKTDIIDKKTNKVLETWTSKKGANIWINEATGDIAYNWDEVLSKVKATYGDTTHWKQYKLDGGTNYRELVFKMPNSSYSNKAMQVHWGTDAEGVLAHTRVQDMTTSDGKKMLFIEEIQSDWHNEGQKSGYRKPGVEEKSAVARRMEKHADEFHNSRIAEVVRERISAVGYEGAGIDMILNFLLDSEDSLNSTLATLNKRGATFTESEVAELTKYAQEYDELYRKWKEAPGDFTPPDAPFKDTYHEYVLKRLLRMAAEEGYDSIGWTTADIQSERWSDEYAEGYRIEYDQDIPKFLRKYGKKWGAIVGQETLNKGHIPEDILEMIDDLERDIEQNRMQMEELNEDDGYWLFLQDGISDMQATIERAKKPYAGVTVWSMPITDSMKDSVLHEGQPKFSRETKPRTTVTAGQYEQMKANLSHSKVYSKKSVMKLVSNIAPGIRNRSFESLSNQLWEGLNSYTTIDDKTQFAEDMSQIFVDRMTVDTLVKHSEWDAAVEKMAYLKTGIGTIDFRDQDASELKYKLDKKYMSLRSRWGYKKNSDGSFKRAYGLDEFISDLSREMPGMEYLAEMHPAEALVEVDKLYTDLSEQIKEKYESAYEDFSDEELEGIRKSIAYEIMNAYNTLGEKTKIAKYLDNKFEEYRARIDFWKAENAKTKKVARWHGIISTKALQIKELKKGAFYNATQHHQDVFKDSIEKLANIQWRGNLKPTQRVSEIFADLKQWYTMDNPMLYSKDADNNLYSDTIATYITKIADSKGAFTEDTYAMVYEVMNHLYTMMRNYNKVFRNGRWEDAPDLVDKYLKIMEETKKNRSAVRRIQDAYNTEFLEPMAVAKRADNYNEDGFFTQTMEDLRRASINASVGEMNLRKEYDAFVDKNKKYLTNAAKETVSYRGHDIPKIHLIGLYMTMKREHARAGLALNGFEYTIKNKWWDSEDHVYVKGYVTDGDNVTQEIINKATEAEMITIEKSFTDIDKQYIEILEKLFNEDLKRLKVERDMERQGYTNATLDYYYPIMRGAMAENIDTAKISDQNRATNASFNKNTVKGARQRLVIISADAMVNRHINDMCKYYYMSQAIENYNVLYNCDVSGNANDPMNIAKLVKETKVWEKDVQYFKKLVSDMQGIRDPQSTAEKALEALRGNYAAFALGLNVKVLFTQFSSMIAAGDVLGFGSILSPKALTVTSADIDTYCPLAAVRNYDAAVIKAMSVSDKIGKVSKALTWGIGKVDRLVVRRLFAACQVEAEKRGSGKIGTEENKIAAGKLLEQVIIETQQNSYATERSQAMRSKNEFLKAVTMFTADGMKIISRMHEAYGEMRAAKKSGDTVKLKKARRKFAKSVAVAVNIAVYMTAIACLFNWIYDRDDEEEDENKMLSLTMDTIGNFISALPILSDLYDFMVDGFEVESPMMDTVNNIFSGINNIRKDAVSIIKRDGERSTQDINRDLRTLLYGVGQATGIPFRNAYNLARGFIGHFTKTGGYKLDSKFYETSLASDLEDAIEKGDNYKASYVMALIYDDRVDKAVSQNQINEIVRLSKLDYSVLPKTIPDKVTRNGKTYTLTATQKDVISKEYAKVTEEIDKLIASSFYKKLSDKDKAYMIDYYHDQYYTRAVNKALKFTNKDTIISDIVGFSKYAEIKFVTKGIESDKDKDGNTISGSKKEKVIEALKKTSLSEEKRLLYIASLGYSLTDAEKTKLIKYLNSLKLSNSTKEKLADMCGLGYKNGKITAKS